MDDHQTGGPRHRSRRKEDAVIRQTIFAGVTPVVGEPFRFLLVNADGKYRTKAPGGLWTQ